MSYTVRWSRQALEMLRRIFPQTAQKEIVDAGRGLQDNPYQGKRLQKELSGCYAIHVARDRHRIIYKIEQSEKRIFIVTVGARRAGKEEDIYVLTRKLLKARLIDKK